MVEASKWSAELMRSPTGRATRDAVMIIDPAAHIMG
jgi:hypothetical protein